MSLLLSPTHANARTVHPGGQSYPPNPIIGSWDVEAHGEIKTRWSGFGHVSGNVVKPAPSATCLKPPEQIWELNGTPGLGSTPGHPVYHGEIEWFQAFGCSSAGFGDATWDLAGTDFGTFCGAPPGSPPGTPEQCHNFARIGSQAQAILAFAIHNPLLSCFKNSSWYKTLGFFCNLPYYASKPGQVRTEVFYCTANGARNLIGEYRRCPERGPAQIYNCVGATGWHISSCTPTQLLLRHATRSARAKGKKAVQVVPVATAGLTFPAEGYGGLDIVATKRGRKLVKKLHKDRKQVKLYIASSFELDDGGPLVVDGASFKSK